MDDADEPVGVPVPVTVLVLGSWNLNGIQQTLRDAVARFGDVRRFFQQRLFAPSVVCFQETKLQEERLEKWIACVEGFESFWSFSRAKKGYSGVVTYTRADLSPLDAMADGSCVRVAAGASGAGERGEGSASQILEAGEGRVMCTDHGRFVLVNVYAPNAGERDEGRPHLEWKLRFLDELQRMCIFPAFSAFPETPRNVAGSIFWENISSVETLPKTLVCQRGRRGVESVQCAGEGRHGRA
eukprot:TRINITY_DN3044_c0_g2_i1.p1 TRINITY_DN3044_c0_g2~~TRINITY_DN3044_c0_g2_i1.p1  ORF type:complete len:251 (-),score=50.16 TRINITY_DN3044_c0_g2_i1:448-1170(-)